MTFDADVEIYNLNAEGWIDVKRCARGEAWRWNQHQARAMLDARDRIIAKLTVEHRRRLLGTHLGYEAQVREMIDWGVMYFDKRAGRALPTNLGLEILQCL